MINMELYGYILEHSDYSTFYSIIATTTTTKYFTLLIFEIK